MYTHTGVEGNYQERIICPKFLNGHYPELHQQWLDNKATNHLLLNTCIKADMFVHVIITV